MFAMFLPAAGCKDKPEPGTDPVEQPDWIVGADLSLLSRIQAAGGVYKDSQGKDVDALSFFKEKGFNYVRLRLFVNPDLQSTASQNLPYV